MTYLYNEIYKLKTLLRRGWLSRKVCKDRYESDAEHIFSTCMIALEIIERRKLQLDVGKTLKMILYHEIGEIEVGDIIPADHVSLEDKYQKEYQVVKKISERSNMPEMLSLWLEFEENKTPEAQFVKKVDKLDAVMQSKIYSEQQNNDALFDEFYTTSKHAVEDFDDIIFEEIKK